MSVRTAAIPSRCVPRCRRLEPPVPAVKGSACTAPSAVQRRTDALPWGPRSSRRASRGGRWLAVPGHRHRPEPGRAGGPRRRGVGHHPLRRVRQRRAVPCPTRRVHQLRVVPDETVRRRSDAHAATTFVLGPTDEHGPGGSRWGLSSVAVLMGRSRGGPGVRGWHPARSYSFGSTWSKRRALVDSSALVPAAQPAGASHTRPAGAAGRIAVLS